MDLINTIWTPTLLGLSSGVYCLSYCLPFVAPFMVSEKRELKKGVKIYFEFILGRLVGYLLFGAVIGWLGWQFRTSMVNLVANFSLLLMALVLILYSLNLFNIKSKHLCAIRLPGKPVPWLLGLLSGINICPPFLFAINLAFTTKSVIGGVVFFAFFFIGTTIFMAPLLFSIQLGYIKSVRNIGRIAAIIVGLTYFIYEIFYFYRAIFIYQIF